MNPNFTLMSTEIYAPISFNVNRNLKLPLTTHTHIQKSPTIISHGKFGFRSQGSLAQSKLALTSFQRLTLTLTPVLIPNSNINLSYSNQSNIPLDTKSWVQEIGVLRH